MYKPSNVLDCFVLFVGCLEEDVVTRSAWDVVSGRFGM